MEVLLHFRIYHTSYPVRLARRPTGKMWICPVCAVENENEETKCKDCGKQSSDSGQHVVYNRLDADDAVGGVNGQSIVSKDDEVRIVLLGRTGSGKSASGNTILDKKEFHSTLSSAAVTNKCKRGTCNRFGRCIQVIDTPGLFPGEMAIEDISLEVVKCVGMTAPGLHAFILVLRVDKHTQEEQNTVKHFIKLFGRGMSNYLIILFTRKDELMANDQTIEDYIGQDSSIQKSVLNGCGGRYVTFNNRGSEGEKKQDVQTLLKAIDKVVEDNRGRVYANEMFEKVERVMQKEEALLKRDYIEPMRLQLAVFRQDITQLVNDRAKVIDQLSRRVNQLDAELDSQSSPRDFEDIIKLLNDMRLQCKNDIQAIRGIRAKKVKLDFRDQARRKAETDGNFLKDKLLPALLNRLPGPIAWLLRMMRLSSTDAEQ